MAGGARKWIKHSEKRGNQRVLVPGIAHWDGMGQCSSSEHVSLVQVIKTTGLKCAQTCYHPKTTLVVVEGMQARWVRVSLEFWGEKGGILVAEVTLVELPLQALHL